MEIKINEKEQHVLFTNSKGEYHLSIDEFNKMGEEKAKEFAESEILKKASLDRYQGKTINFEQARGLGFCEYGIEDFCEQLDIDKDATHDMSNLLEILTPEVFLSYASECRKLFGKDTIMNKFGGVKKFLSDNRTSKALHFVLSNGFISEKQLHILTCDFAERVLPIFEKEYPDDNRPRRAIEVKRLWLEEEYA